MTIIDTPSATNWQGGFAGGVTDGNVFNPLPVLNRSLIGQERLPKPQPSPHPSPNNQQKQFNDCVSPAVSKYWRGYTRSGGKAIAGAASAGAGIALFAGAPQVGFGLRAASATLNGGVIKTTLFFALSEVADGGVISLVPSLGGTLMVRGLDEMIKNRRLAEQAVAECARRFPNAMHFVLP